MEYKLLQQCAIFFQKFPYLEMEFNDIYREGSLSGLSTTSAAMRALRLLGIDTAVQSIQIGE